MDEFCFGDALWRTIFRVPARARAFGGPLEAWSACDSPPRPDSVRGASGFQTPLSTSARQRQELQRPSLLGPRETGGGGYFAAVGQGEVTVPRL